MIRLATFRNESIRCLFFVCVFLCGILSASAERLPIKVYTSSDGLGSSASFSLVRDSRGFIWICSRDGLVRFDGYRFITYRIGNDEADPAVYSLLPTREGVYWINLNRGTDYRFIDKGDSTPLEPIQQLVSGNDPRVPLVNVEPITDLRFPSFEDSAGNLWSYEAKGIDLLREVDGKTVAQLTELKLPGNPDDEIKSVVFSRGSENSFWIGTNWGLVRRLPDGKFVHFTFDSQKSGNVISRFAEDKDHRVWIAREDGILVLKVEPVSQLAGLEAFTSRKVVIKSGKVGADGQAQLPTQAGEAFRFTFHDIFLRNARPSPGGGTIKPIVWGFLCGADGTIWITSLGGLVSFDGKRFQHFTENQGLASNNVSEIVEDNDGNIWIGSYGGLMRLNPNGMTSFDARDGLGERRVNSIYETKRGELYVVADNWNISQLRSGVFKTGHPELPNGSFFFWHSNVAMLDSRGDWWVITSKQLYRYSGVDRIEDLASRKPTAVYTDQNGLISNETNSLFEDSHGDVWITSDPTAKRTGLTRWQRASGQFQHFFIEDGLPAIAYCSAFTEDRAGNLWFGFGEGGLRRFRDGRFTTLDAKDGAPPSGIMNLFTDSKGRLWIASSISGLTRIDDPTVEHSTWRRYTIADGLTSNNIRCITEDLFGNIYIGTVRGVNRISPDTGHIKYYGTGDGLPGDFVSVAHRDHSGAIWFGTFSGLSRLIPEPDVTAPPPPTLISRVRIAGVDYTISPLGQTDIVAPEQAANRNNLEIDFFSISPGDSAATRYQYELEGADQNWSRPTTQRSVTFANLRPGNYRFLVRAVNADGVAGERPATITFRILPPVWQRWWFLTLAALLVIGGVIALDRYRVAHAKQLGAVREERLRELERVRKRIATDLHDDIGSTLTQISIMSEVARQRIGPDGSQISEPLDMIATSSREVVDAMSDIVWAINPQRDRFGDLIQRMRRFAADTLTARNIELNFRVPNSADDWKVGANLRREIFLIFKESVNNIAKHAGSKKVDILVRFQSDKLLLRLQDDGQGFDQTVAGEGHGLTSMSERAQGIGGQLVIESRPGHGTTTTLTVPLTHR